MFSLVVHASMKVTSTVLQKIYNKRQLVILIFFAMIKEPFKNVFFCLFWLLFTILHQICLFIQ